MINFQVELLFFIIEDNTIASSVNDNLSIYHFISQ